MKLITLDSPDWTGLSHAYGSAHDIPELLKAVYQAPEAHGFDSEVLGSLWSSLCHQGDAYSASFAAAPHLTQVSALHESVVHWSVPQLVICIEIARLTGRAPKLAPSFEPAYSDSIRALPQLMTEIHNARPTELTAMIAAAAFSVTAGLAELAEAQLDLTAEIAPKFLEWIMES